MSKLQKDSYVTKMISETALELLKERNLVDISISEITSRANVSRCSFYRNYKDKGDIFQEEIQLRIYRWQDEYNRTYATQNGATDGTHMWKDLFRYLKDDEEFYILLEKRGLLYLLGDAIYNVCGPKSEQPDSLAYFSSYVARGVYGWIEEWIRRGMRDEYSSEVMSYLKILSNL